MEDIMPRRGEDWPRGGVHQELEASFRTLWVYFDRAGEHYLRGERGPNGELRRELALAGLTIPRAKRIVGAALDQDEEQGTT